jgi:ElaB/YqjD/DUF883 family membrane-anchored ribosome-binding protein
MLAAELFLLTGIGYYPQVDERREPMYENSGVGTQNGESIQENAAQAKERLRAKAAAAGESLRERADQARGWARSQMDGLQSRVEAQPYRASAWALGIGVVAGVLLASLLRSGQR